MPDGLRDVCGRERRLVARTRERYAADPSSCSTPGSSLAAISRVLSLDRKTVQRFARAARADELLAKATSRESRLDPFKPYICQRWNEGLTDAAALHAELPASGWTGSVQTVRRYVRPFRQARPPRRRPPRPCPRPARSPAGCCPAPTTSTPDEQAQLAAIQDRCPHLDALAGHVRSFAEMMTGRQRHS